MVEKHQIDLFSQNTMRLHSVADIVYYPESVEDLKELCSILREGGLVLSAGSNVILPPKLHRPVISLMNLNDRIKLLDNRRVYVGCSVRVQKLIRFLQKNNLGGIEYLYSVPASVGGLVFMNGGRGRKYNKSIADYIETVEYFDLDDMVIKTYKAKRSDFTYRHSLFQEMNVIILAVCFRFLSQEASITESLINERLAFSNHFLSPEKPSCGSVFSKGNPVLFRLLKGMRVGGAMFSKKTPNWISNIDNASYEDICKLIKRARVIHTMFFSSCQTEIIIIKK